MLYVNEHYPRKENSRNDSRTGTLLWSKEGNECDSHWLIRCEMTPHRYKPDDDISHLPFLTFHRVTSLSYFLTEAERDKTPISFFSIHPQPTKKKKSRNLERERERKKERKKERKNHSSLLVTRYITIPILPFKRTIGTPYIPPTYPNYRFKKQRSAIYKYRLPR